MTRKTLLMFAGMVASISWVGSATAFDHMKWPDGRQVDLVEPNPQVDLSNLRSGVSGKAVDRRFTTNDAMFLANEIYLSGPEFFLEASKKKLPIAHDRELSYITNVEAYWYSRYNLFALSGRSRNGIGMVQGPYVELAAQEDTKRNHLGRSRGELNVANKGEMLTKVVASVVARSGLPAQFDNAVPLMLEFKSGDPHFLQPVDLTIDGTGQPRYQHDFASLRWSNDGMDKTIDMGGVGQAMLKKVLWAKFFLRRNHTDADFPGRTFIGNNAEDGFRGGMLTLQAVSTMLMTKAALFCGPSEENCLTGIDPTAYKPADGVHYIPHEIYPTLVYQGDLPVRQYDFSAQDRTSRLWDVASWLWATTEYFDYSNPRQATNWRGVFGYNTPYDGSVMDQKYSLLARALANVQLDNLESMHAVNGVLAATWDPKTGVGSSTQLSDLSLAMVALEDYAGHMDREPERRNRATALLRRQGEFLLTVAAKDGSYTQSYRLADGVAEGKRDMTSQAFAIRGLLAAYHATKDNRYLAAAQRTYATWNRDFWDSQAWLFRNEPGSAQVTYTPVDVGAALGAMREMMLTDNDAGADAERIDRFKKFFVQAVDASGLMQAEDVYTGESLAKIQGGETDSDHDGIPFIGRGDGPYGIDTVFASRVTFDLTNGPVRQSVSVGGNSRPTTGEGIFLANCAVCHGVGGAGHEGPSLINNPFVQAAGAVGVAQTIAAGRTSVGMPAWGGILNEEEIGKVVDYIRTLGLAGKRAAAG